MLKEKRFIGWTTNNQIRGREKQKKIFFSMLNGLRWAALCFFLNSMGYASSISINPIRLELLAGEKITSFEVKNNSDQPIVAQLHAMTWIYKDGKDIYKPTENVLITPPIIKIAPQEAQIVRVGLLTLPDPKKGAVYRVFLREVLQPSSPSFIGVHTLLEIIFPLLVDPLVPVKPKISFFTYSSGKQAIKVKLLNSGESHFKIRKITLREKGKPESLVEKNIFNYLIPSQSKEWDIEIPKSFRGRDIQVSAETDQGEVSEIVCLPPS